MLHRHFFVIRLTLILALSLMMMVPAVLAENNHSPLPPTASYDATVATEWFSLQLHLTQTTPGFSPPIASRAFAYSGVALYEAVVAGMPDYQSLAGQLNGLKPLPQPVNGLDYHWAIVANSALANIMRFLFATTSAENHAAIDLLEVTLLATYGLDVDADVMQRSITQGRVIADAIAVWSVSDGGHAGYRTNFDPAYQPPTGDGLWVSTPRLDGGEPQPALQPHWGEVRPFVLTSGAECAPPAPPTYSEDADSAFYLEALEVFEVVENLTPEQEAIALFWADDPGRTPTPPGHSISILTQVLQAEGSMLDVAAEAYARVGIVVADAFIACWYVKYEYNLLRPITYIRELMKDDWMSPVNTPPFPEFPSGHSTQSGATAEVLTYLFGDNYAFTDHTHDSRGMEPRSFGSFYEAADEAAISRLYGGIHYRAAIDYGIEQGRCIGQRIIALQFKR